MKKMFKIIAMLLVIATVVFAAGCADKTAEPATTEETSEEAIDETPVTVEETDGPSAAVDGEIVSVVADDGGNEGHDDGTVPGNDTNFTDNDTNVTPSK